MNRCVFMTSDVVIILFLMFKKCIYGKWGYAPEFLKKRMQNGAF